jgi:hypothetical protein
MKIVDEKIVPMTLEDTLAAGTVTEEDYLSTKTAQALAEVDPEYAAGRKAKIAALLAAKQQPGWPVNVVWPDPGQ